MNSLQSVDPLSELPSVEILRELYKETRNLLRMREKADRLSSQGTIDMDLLAQTTLRVIQMHRVMLGLAEASCKGANNATRSILPTL